MAKSMDDFLLDAIREINATFAGDDDAPAIFNLTEDLNHWHDYGIYTPKQLYWYLDFEHFVNVYKSEYGFKPRGLNWTHADILDWLEEVAEEQANG